MKRGFLIWAVLVLLAYGAAGCEKVIDVIDDRTGGDEGPTVTGYVFQQMSGIPSDVTLNDIFGFAADDVYIVATGATNRGIIFHYDGTSWTEVGPGDFPVLYTVWGSAPNDVWVAGENYQSWETFIAHYDGSYWTPTPVESNTMEDYSSLWGTAWNDVWLANGVGGLLHWDGVSWSDVKVTKSFDYLSGVWASSPEDLYVGGENLYHFDGWDWETQFGSNKISVTFNALWGSSESDVFLAAGGIWHSYGDGNWVQMSTSGVLRAIFGGGPHNAVAVGREGAILHYSGSNWQSIDSGVPIDLWGVWIAPDQTAFVIGDHQVVLMGVPLE